MESPSLNRHKAQRKGMRQKMERNGEKRMKAKENEQAGIERRKMKCESGKGKGKGKEKGKGK
jgi:hypothetical protein